MNAESAILIGLVVFALAMIVAYKTWSDDKDKD